MLTVGGGLLYAGLRRTCERDRHRAATGRGAIRFGGPGAVTPACPRGYTDQDALVTVADVVVEPTLGTLVWLFLESPAYRFTDCGENWTSDPVVSTQRTRPADSSQLREYN